MILKYTLMAFTATVCFFGLTMTSSYHYRTVTLPEQLESGRIRIDSETVYKCEPTEMTKIYRVTREEAKQDNFQQ